jgi:hypothetical protein
MAPGSIYSVAFTRKLMSAPLPLTHEVACFLVMSRSLCHPHAAKQGSSAQLQLEPDTRNCSLLTVRPGDTLASIVADARITLKQVRGVAGRRAAFTPARERSATDGVMMKVCDDDSSLPVVSVTACASPP